jgi:lipopolysaccharide/colanic/teichoic acid biosynthesis glycosyltransferase
MKRVFDIVVASAAAILTAPLLVGVAVVVRAAMGSPVLFSQLRPGRHGRPFRIYKFRTMTSATGSDGRPMPDGMRLTPVGRFLRSTSLDELPELWNVLRGDMSLVGPRPLLMEYLPLYTPEQARRHEVRPGLTGWAQVNGRNAVTWEERFALDVWYVEHRSLWLDLVILLRTVRKVLTREGVSQEGHATMTPFGRSGE